VLYAFYALFAVKGFCFGAFAYLPRAMVADVVDVDTARSRDSRPASYFAILGFMTKLATSFGFLSLPALGLVGFDPRAGAAHDASELAWLGVLYAIVPTVLFLAALYLAWTWPLTPERHARLRLGLERRVRRARDTGSSGAGASETGR
jgi:Na+/melibiose symporter-like transporter